jgi:DNA-binding transcriptional ArsR family regulator
MIKRLTYTLVFFIILSLNLKGQDSYPKLQAEIDTNIIRIGEPITLNLEVSYHDKTEIFWPETPENKLSNFDIIEIREYENNPDNGILNAKRDYVITAFDTGFVVLEPVPVEYIKKDKTKPDTLFSEPLLIKVETVEVDTTKPFKPIKPPLNEPKTWRDYIWYMAIALLAIILLIAWFIWNKKRKQKPKEEKPLAPVIKIPAHETALKDLQKLAEEKLWQNGEVKAYHSRLSEIVRNYIENRFNILALESTREEILHALNQVPVRNALIKDLNEILEIADWVKFAKMQPLPEDHERNWQLAKKFVLETKLETMQNDTTT